MKERGVEWKKPSIEGKKRELRRTNEGWKLEAQREKGQRIF